jgi:hypothetical protein
MQALHPACCPEAKAEELGAKVNPLQMNGLSFTEYISYDSCNEGISMGCSFGNEKNH